MEEKNGTGLTSATVCELTLINGRRDYRAAWWQSVNSDFLDQLPAILNAKCF